MSDKVDKLAQSVARLERLFTDKAVKHSVHQILDPNQNQHDLNTLTEIAEGYSHVTPQEQRMARERADIRNIVFDPQVVEAAQKHGVTAEKLVEGLLNKGPQKISELRGQKVTDFVAETVGLELKESGGDSFFDPGISAKMSPARRAKVRELQKKSRGTDEDLQAIIDAGLFD